MRKFLMILGGIAAFAVAVVAFVFWLTSGMTGVASDFMAKIRTGDNNGAYNLTSPGFRENVSFRRFETWLKQRRFDKLGEPSWSSRNIKGMGESAVGRVKGSVKIANGGSQPIEITLTKSGGKWVVHHLEIRTGGVSNAAAAGNRKPPPEKELVKLVSATNDVFAQAVEKKDMKILHDHISALWRKQVTVEELAKIYGAFLRDNVRLGGLRNLTPVFDGPPKIDARGVMRITGYYDSRPDRAQFRHSYIYEGLGWKLMGLGMTLRRAPASGDKADKPAGSAPAGPAPANGGPQRSP